MTSQAINSMKLYKGQQPSKIQQLLALQRESVVNELMNNFGAKDIVELSIKLSMG